MTTPILLTNGSWHGGWCWASVIQAVAGRGAVAAAVELEGFGGLRGGSPQARWSRPFDPEAFRTEVSPVAKVTLASAAARLVADITEITGGEPCVLVAHSLGGTVATAAAELAPHLIGELVYVAAMAPVAGLPAAAYNALPEMSDSLLMGAIVADPAAIGAIRCDPADPAQHEHLRQAFYGDVDREIADAAMALLSSDAPLGVGVEPVLVTRERFGSIPHTYVVTLRDNIVRPRAQRRIVDEIGAVSASPATVVELDSSHSPFLSQPHQLAAILDDARQRLDAR